MKKRNRALLFPFCPVPAGLLAFRSAAGQEQILTIGWVGVVCSSPAIISVSCRRHAREMSELPQGNAFSINLPPEEMLASSGFRKLVQCEDIRLLVGSGLYVENGMATGGPLLAGSQVSIECSRATVSSRFGEEVVSGEVIAVHLEGEIYGPEGMPDLSRLKPFNRPSSRPPGAEAAAGRSFT